MLFYQYYVIHVLHSILLNTKRSGILISIRTTGIGLFIAAYNINKLRICLASVRRYSDTGKGFDYFLN